MSLTLALCLAAYYLVGVAAWVYVFCGGKGQVTVGELIKIATVAWLIWPVLVLITVFVVNEDQIDKHKITWNRPIIRCKKETP